MEIKIKEGGIWEESEFVIDTNYEIDEEYDLKCRHINNGKLKGVVIATNEGGYNTTGVCVECLIEALRDNGFLNTDKTI